VLKRETQNTSISIGNHT